MKASLGPTLQGPDQHSSSTGAETRPAVPSEESAASALSSTANSASSAPIGNPRRSKRSRNFDAVTPRACTECRKKRAKCDGQKPCGRCNARNIECIYIPFEHVSKAVLRREIDSLRERQRASDRLIAALVRPVLEDEILSRLRDGQSVESIAERLGESVRPGFSTLPAFCRDVPQLSMYNCSQSRSSSTSNSHSNAMRWKDDMRNLEWADIGRLPTCLVALGEPEIGSVYGTWTSVTSDINLVHHLLALYFCWEYPTFAPLSKEHFLRDFREGRHRYCSPMLVNALLALGCRFSSNPVVRLIPDNHLTSGDHFFQEALRFFYQAPDHHSLTTIQALGIMSVRESSCGRHSMSRYYAGQSIRLALEMGLHRVWSLATNSLPHLSRFPQFPPKRSKIKNIEESLWIPYMDNGALLQHVCAQASNVLSVFTCVSELSELVHRSLYLLNSPGNPYTMKEIVSLYTSYLECNSMYYQFAVLSLFRSSIKIDTAQPRISPPVICSQAANAIQSLVKSFSLLYSLRMAPSFMSHLLLASASMSVAVDAVPEGFGIRETEAASTVSPYVPEAITRGMAGLSELAPTQQSAEQALNILRGLVEKWGISSTSTAHTSSSGLNSKEQD
ncbi:hypothetical protein B0J15DRAFT_516500 [Fusarium solani]|uniref:Zn(2)-C6 fungal-type domain-containing protein n=1 Tax=Fusarium solani TaxID=169388 RepID=A0A9P9GF33_FUSSL|nr:uncharacterized protein B0J15DRAFT_516500 [Fusarium solani]KAH7237916.1 hypothetical protein B0J15DRAFT_516500 [Fusarium solani]